MTVCHSHRGTTALLMVMAVGTALPFTHAVRAVEMPRAITLTLADYGFSPAHIEVTAGTPVTLTLTNKDTLTPHTFKLQNTQAGLNIDVDVGAGRSVVVEFTPRVAGTYRFHCDKKLPFLKSHLARGMEGTLTVTRLSAN